MRNDTSLLPQTVLSALGSYNIQNRRNRRTAPTSELKRDAASAGIRRHPPYRGLRLAAKNIFVADMGVVFSLTSPFIGHVTPNGVKTGVELSYKARE
jgi:hypothetical protein